MCGRFLIVFFFAWIPNNGRAEGVEFNEPHLGLFGSTRHDCHGGGSFYWALGAAARDAHAAVTGAIRLVAFGDQPAPS